MEYFLLYKKWLELLPLEIVRHIAQYECRLYKRQLRADMKAFDRKRFSLRITERGLTWKTCKKNIKEAVLKKCLARRMLCEVTTSESHLCVENHTMSLRKMCVCCRSLMEDGRECDCFDKSCGNITITHYTMVHLNLLFFVRASQCT